MQQTKSELIVETGNFTTKPAQIGAEDVATHAMFLEVQFPETFDLWHVDIHKLGTSKVVLAPASGQQENQATP